MTLELNLDAGWHYISYYEWVQNRIKWTTIVTLQRVFCGLRENIKSYINVMHNYANFCDKESTISISMRPFKKILISIRLFWKISISIGLFWKISISIRRFWKISILIEIFWYWYFSKLWNSGGHITEEQKDSVVIL